MSKKIAVILSGCGVYDGAEIQEAVLSLYYIKIYGASYQIFAPDTTQHHVVNHITGEEMNESRNVMIEAARIARGEVLPLEELAVKDFDAVLFPGGFGAAKNLSSYAFDGAELSVLPEVERIIKETSQAKKPIGALCVAPVLLAKVLGNIDITLGVDQEAASNVEKLGATHINTSHTDVIYDHNHKVITSPCYMLDATIDQVGKAIDKVVGELIALS